MKPLVVVALAVSCLAPLGLPVLGGPAGALAEGWPACDPRAAVGRSMGPRPASARDETFRWLAGGWTDYAPNGVPDFSQCRPAWGRPGESGRPGQWTFAGPVAAADALWWLDSVAEPFPMPPSQAHDGYRLVTAYPRFGPPLDDHDTLTMVQLVEDLALRAHTDGKGSPRDQHGTRWEDLVVAVSDFVTTRGLGADLAVQTIAPPDTASLRPSLEAGAGVILALGLWEEQDGGWFRVGGHYAALAGWAPPEQGAPGGRFGQVALADPLADTAALSGAGRTSPPDPAQHSCRNQPRAHDDAAVVAHDRYRLVDTPALPGGRLVLDGYFTAANEGEGAAFAGQNPMDALKDATRAWQGGTLAMALDAALIVRPLDGGRRPSPTLPATPAPPQPTEVPELTPTAWPSPTASTAPPTHTPAAPSETPPATGRPTEPNETPSAPPTGGTTTMYLPAAILFDRESPPHDRAIGLPPIGTSADRRPRARRRDIPSAWPGHGPNGSPLVRMLR